MRYNIFDEDVTMYFNFKKDLKYIKIILGITENELADFAEVSRMTLSRWQNGDAIPSYEALEKFYNKAYEAGINLNKVKEEMYGSSLEDNHLLLFHGAKSELHGHPTIAFSEGKKDFGKGFYLGESLAQSASFVVGYERSSVYVFDFDKADTRMKEFSVSEEWMLLIAYFRGRLDEYKESSYLKKLIGDLNGYDVIIAPIADNTMYTTLDDFISGKITDLQCLNALSANRLGMQYVFLNDDIMKDKLKMLERCFYCRSERKDYQAYRLKESEVGKNKVKIALRENAGKGKYIEELLK